MKIRLILSFVLASVIALSQNSRIQKNDFPSGRYFLTSFTIGDTAFVGLGSNDMMGLTYSSEWFRYDPENDSWDSLNDFPGGGRYAPTTFVVNNQAYLCFGVDDTHTWLSEVWKYSQTTDTWERKADFPGGPRYHAASFVIDSMAYIMGGSYNNGWDYLNDTWQYNPTTDNWSQILDIPEVPRTAAVSFVVNNIAFVGTGTDYFETFKTFWCYDPVTLTWNPSAFLPSDGSHRYGSTAFVINNEAFLIAGRPGMYPEPCTLLSDVWSYAISTDIQKIRIQEFRVYPNPTSDFIHIILNRNTDGNC
ncbi:MAG: kelch repeat-containing protein [bacterium]